MLSTSLFQVAFGLAAFAASASATILGVDSSSLVPESTYSTAKGEGFTKAVIRGFEEACGVGGQVDPNFVSAYKNARAAGKLSGSVRRTSGLNSANRDHKYRHILGVCQALAFAN